MTVLAMIFAVTLIVATAAVAWVVQSRIYLHARRTWQCNIRDYLDAIALRFKVDVDLNDWDIRYLRGSGGTCLAVYVKEGPPNSPVVVFMPGTAAYAQIYSQFLFLLVDQGYTVVAYDPRGHGRSADLRGLFTVDQMVDDGEIICTWAARRWNTKVAFMGSSQGGVVGLYMAARGNPAVATVICHDFAVLDGTTILRLSSFKPPLFLVPFLVWVFKRLWFLVVPVTFYIPFGSLKVPDGSSAVAFISNDPMGTPAYSLWSVAWLTKTPLARPLDEITTPIMLLSSTGDQVFPVSYLRAIYDRLTCEKKWTLIPKLPHLILINNPRVCVPSVTAWLDRWLKQDGDGRAEPESDPIYEETSGLPAPSPAPTPALTGPAG